MVRIDTGNANSNQGSRPPRRTQDLSEVIAEINAMVGLTHVKHELNRLIAFAEVIKLRRDRDMPVGPISLHMVFTGPPGTGKTVIARKVARILSGLKLLRKGHLVEVDKSRLVAGYVGQTEKLVKERVEEAMDGVLFIDEAYTLAGKFEDGILQGRDPFGQEAIDTLLKAMEDHRDRLVVIAAGYTNEMRQFINSNPGLRSRFSRTIEFESNMEEELKQIFIVMVRNSAYFLDPEADHESSKHIKEMWGNADERFGSAPIRQFFESILPFQADRISRVDDFESLSNTELQTITAEDIQAAIDAM